MNPEADSAKPTPPENTPPDVAQEIVTTPVAGVTPNLQSVTFEAYSGPIMPPAIMGGYNQVVEGGADRVLKIIEGQAAEDQADRQHAREISRILVTEEVRRVRDGQTKAFWLAIVFGVFGLIALWMGHPIVAGAIFGTLIIGLVAVFALGQVPGNNDSAPEDAKEPKKLNSPPGQQG